MRKLLAAVALALLAGACERSPVSVGPGLTITTSQTAYAAGELIVTRIANTGDEPLAYDPCMEELQQQLATGEWSHQGVRFCTAELRAALTIAPGAVQLDSVRTPIDLPAGTYRLLYAIGRLHGGLLYEAVRASNLFTLEP